MAENYKGYTIEKLGGRFQVTRGSDQAMIFHHIREAYAWVDSQAGDGNETAAKDKPKTKAKK